MQTVTTIGLDTAKSVFQVHGVDAAGQVLIRRQLKRRTVLAFFEKLHHRSLQQDDLLHRQRRAVRHCSRMGRRRA